MTSETTGTTYDRAGFGRAVRRGRRPAVLVVDFSYGFTDPGYPTGADMSGPVRATRRLLDTARAAGLPRAFTTIAYGPGEARTLTWLDKATGMAALTAGSRLVEIDSALDPRPDEPVFVKHGASAFFGTPVASYLVASGADTLVVTGATTSGCVRASVVDAVQLGFPVLVPREAVADRAPEPHEANLFDIQQKYGDVVEIDDALTYLAAPGREGDR
ncbi:Nicotinamidase-related amidase [Pseudonocardia ammonioxydans]|uniref:Nicotinamidase-related amidase n=1 Tax=Pseudonocardia ammonioxydans TaxID=260086 RepID=A0A1I4ZT89_PSUAM|nr:isochorismatase family protein [Pseudonocardia ammonioxydans]SFN53431.1 Nicotinamidase-related amidase [Pseudonocardia ammonioxydans]